VQRAGSQTDLRAKQVVLTLKGRELVDRVLTVHGQQIEMVLSGLNTKEQAEFQRLMGRVGQHLEGLLTAGSAVG
jgi:DNA-binding MarR family transcriptional regulator